MQAINAVDNPIFDRVIILLILLNCGFLAAWDPKENPCSGRNQVLDQAELVFLVLFSVEMIVKLVEANEEGQERLDEELALLSRQPGSKKKISVQNSETSVFSNYSIEITHFARKCNFKS